MYIANVRRLSFCVALLAGVAQTVLAAEILIVDAKSQPESLTVAPGGVLIVGSASTPFVYKVRPGSTTAEKFIDASAEGAGTFFFGMLADAATNTLWTCQLTPVPDTTPVKRHTALRGFDLSTGAQKIRWNLPGDNSTCNDFAIGPDKALYIADTANSKIYRLPGRRFHCRTIPGTSRALWHRRHHLFERHAVREQRVFEQSLPHPSGRRGQGRATRRYLDGSARKGTGWHAGSQRQAHRCREWQRQDFRYYRQWRQGQRHGNQGRTQDTNRQSSPRATRSGSPSVAPARPCRFRCPIDFSVRRADRCIGQWSRSPIVIA